MSLASFLAYHNAVPIAVSILIVGGASAFAATNPETIYSVQETVVAVDNTYIASKDFSSWTPTVRITGVTEDGEYYYVAYDFTTVDIRDHVWQDVVKQEVMKVSKADLGPYRDLGLYVMEQLTQVVDREIAYLKEVQAIERRNISQKTVAVEYGGLVGAFLDDRTEVVAGYIPVVTPPAPVAVGADETPPAEGGLVAGASASPNADLGPEVVLAGDPSDTEPPFIQVLGANPAVVRAGDTYLDLGVVAADGGSTENVTLTLYLNGDKVERVYMQSATVGTWVVTYEARDKVGNVARVKRNIIVFASTAPQETQQTTQTPAQETLSEPESSQESPTTAPAQETEETSSEEGAQGEKQSPPAETSEETQATTTPA